ncbi:Hypothetical Protein FCC1311_018752 [Hondaea fermentalgiana]|uniref:Glycerophosphocholine acyltransferase 1 n=1 Tax=Hondaea fermentalgiana TaxID=2315210 RepID=A0A2R5G3P4_9STRA|nr:Hypothetical Protein FCC1311_018752 [Hondaea fermentalgiana]|eukprot:GBG25656.1 Hypothetical Protein FCC1311_018752 [Hondaea fermentalgiana]
MPTKVAPDSHGEEGSAQAVETTPAATNSGAKGLSSHSGSGTIDTKAHDGKKPETIWRSNSLALQEAEGMRAEANEKGTNDDARTDTITSAPTPTRASKQLTDNGRLESTNTISGRFHEEDVQDMASHYFFSNQKARDRFLDKVTFCAIHMVPLAVTFCIRWHPGDTVALWPRGEAIEFIEGDLFEGLIGLPDAIALPLLALGVFVSHQLLQYFIIYILARARFAQNYLRIHQDKEYLTLFRYTVASGGFMACKVLGEKYQVLSWYLMNAIFAFMSFFPAYAMYRWEPVDVAFALIVTLRAIQNAANFYLEVFACSYSNARSVVIRPPVGKIAVPEAEYHRLVELAAKLEASQKPA